MIQNYIINSKHRASISKLISKIYIFSHFLRLNTAQRLGNIHILKIKNVNN